MLTDSKTKASAPSGALRFPALCQNCVYKTGPVMLTGYCLKAHTCDGCKRSADCAMTATRDAATCPACANGDHEQPHTRPCNCACARGGAV